MATYYTDVANQGTILRPASKQKDGEIICVWRPPVGVTLGDGDPAAADVINICTLGAYIRPTLIRVTSNGLAGTDTPGSRAASGLVLSLGWNGETGAPTAAPGGFIATITDAEDLILYASDSGLNGTVFPGTGTGGTKQIYNPTGNLLVQALVTTSNTSVFTAGAELVFYIQYEDANVGRTNEEFGSRLTLDPQGLDWSLVDNLNGQAGSSN
jgi:hypothetical protein